MADHHDDNQDLERDEAEHASDDQASGDQASEVHVSNDHAHDDDHDEHGGMGKYLVVFGCLLVLTLSSFVAGSMFSGPDVTDPSVKTVGWAVMMAVSCAKALLVMLFFMHLLWEANWKYVLTIPATIMSTLLLLALVPDVGWRTRHYAEERIRYAPELSTFEHAHAEPGHAEPGHAEPGHAEPGHAEPGHAEPGHAEPGHAEPAHAEPGRPKTDSATPDPSGN